MISKRGKEHSIQQKVSLEGKYKVKILGREIVHWYSIKVGLWKRHGPTINVRMCTCSTTFIKTLKTQNTTGFTIPPEKSIYGKNNHILSEKEPDGELDEKNQKWLQNIVGKLMYYCRDIYPTMLM